MFQKALKSIKGHTRTRNTAEIQQDLKIKAAAEKPKAAEMAKTKNERIKADTVAKVKNTGITFSR